VWEPLGLVREGLRLLLEEGAQCEVVAAAPSRVAALDAARRLAPELVVAGLDRGARGIADAIVLDMPALGDLFEAAPTARVLVVTAASDPSQRVAAIRAGAHGVIGLERSTADFVAAVRRVLDGDFAIDADLVPHLLRSSSGQQPPAAPADPLAGLTPRERQVAALVGEGLRNKQVAARLAISEITVRHHLTAVYAKLGVQDRVEFVLKVMRGTRSEGAAASARRP